MASIHLPNVDAKQLKFIKIILSEDPKSTKLELPIQFSELEVGNFPDTVTFNMPNDDVWQVELIKSNATFWFGFGWSEFVDHYKVRFGDLLVFKFDGVSSFNVSIYNPTSCEIDYSSKSDNVSGSNSIQGKVTTTLETSEKLNLGESNIPSSSAHRRVFEKNITGNSAMNMPSTVHDRKLAYEKAKDRFKSDKPFFMAYISSGQVRGKTGLHIPEKFIDQNWTNFKQYQKCVLAFGGKEWETTTCSCSLGVGGWKVFLKDNSLNVGDVCAFELMDKDNNVLRVSIFKNDSLV